MINTTIISAEASATVNSGVAAKGKQKGKSQSLFSKLLTTLQQGSQNQTKNNKESSIKDPQQKTEEIPVSHNVLEKNKVAQKTGQILSVPVNSDEKFSSPKEGTKSKVTNTSETIVAVVQQAPLILQTTVNKNIASPPQPADKTSPFKQNDNQPLTALMSQQTQSTSNQKNSKTPITVTSGQLSTSNKEALVSTANSLQSQAKSGQHANISTSERDQQISKNTPPFASIQQAAIKKEPLLSQDLKNQTIASSKQTQFSTRPTSNATNQTVGTPNIFTLEKVDPAQKQKGVVSVNTKPIENANTPVLSFENKAITSEKQAPRLSSSQLNNKDTAKESNISPPSGKQITLAPTQQRAPTQEQVGSPVLAQPVGIKNIDSSTSSQQDFTSNHQSTNTSALDMDKTTNKTHGIDFQAQLAYRSQRTFTPGDTMLAIVKSAKNGSTSLELQLEPANLGKVQVSIQMDAQKQIQVAFTVDQNASRQALEQHMPQLRLALAQQGLDLGGFTMQMNQQNQQQNQSSAHQTGTNPELLSDVELVISQENRIGVNIATDGRLNILA